MSNSLQHAVAADHVFDGERLHEKAAVVIDGARIVGVVPQAELPVATPVHRLPEGAWLAPGFVDLQVNGGGDVLFNDEPTPKGISTIVEAHRKFGTTALLPTLITDRPETMTAGIEAVQETMEHEPGVLGIHLEGPFLSPEKPGVHDVRLIRTPTPEDRKTLSAPRNGVMLVTLAPERVPKRFIGQLVDAGVHVALGHSMATYAQTCAAVTEGLTGFTHLFNAMRPLESREPGPIAAALESNSVWFSLIVDGVHVDAAVLRLALRGAGRPVLVTDAMPPVGGKHASFTLYGEEITVKDGRCTRADGTLAGAALDMATAVRNCVRLLDVALPDALRFASSHPAQAIGLGRVLGKLGPGFRADMIAFDPSDIRVFESWVAGRWRPATPPPASER